MNIGIYVRDSRIAGDTRLEKLISALRSSGCQVYAAGCRDELASGTDLLLSVGGDGTFLSSAMIVGDSGIPVLGVNLGRLGFLSENSPESVAEAIVSGNYTIENRTLLKVSMSSPSGCGNIDGWPFALNEVTVHRAGGAMLGVDVTLDGAVLPTYWADGLLVATSSGSTAYSLSVGGPIVVPDSRVLIVAPIASHNLNVRPLVVPDTSVITIGLKARDENVRLSLDNRTVEIGRDVGIVISMAQFSLRRVRLNGSSFINALTEKLFWGEDIRNTNEHNRL